MRPDRRFGAWIAGSWQSDGAFVDDINPATGRPWAQVAQADEFKVDAAVGAAREACGAWRAVSPSDRGELLTALARVILAEADSLAEAETSDNGKPLWQTRGEMQATARWFSYFGGAADKLDGSAVRVSDTRLGVVLRRPLGVVAALSPFNAPFSLAAWKVAPALAAGNCVVIKPSPTAPVTPLMMGELASRAGLPDGVLNVIAGGGDTGAALVRHPDVAAVSFTGSTETAQRIAAAAATTMKRVLLEAGGKCPYIVFDDASLDDAVPPAVAAIFGTMGQSCVASSRMLVHRKVYDEFVSRMIARAESLRIGDPMDERTHVGPLSSAAQLEKVGRYVASARADGLDVVTGGSRPDDARLDGGFYYRPTLITGAANSMPIAQEEIFGPVGLILPFDHEDEAVAIANDSPFGLAAGIWTKDIGRAHRVADRLEVGTIWINCYRAFHWTLPFGGYKKSGYGRENGLEALRELTQVQTMVTDYGAAVADPFAGVRP